jgi:hypothetical protein
MFMKRWFVNKRDHDLLTHPNRFKDLRGSFDRMAKDNSSGIYLLIFAFVAGAADFFSIETS